jgi:solute carrier family 35 (UDP-xylose/UDP-N-acetylglucosamine transporter), member B4
MASSSSSRARAMAVPLALILGGCVVNNIALEVMISDKIRWSDVKAGPLLTLLQYALVSLLMLPKALELAPVADDVAGAKGPSAVSGAWGGAVTAGGWRLSLRPTTVPLPHYARMAGLFAVMSLLNNLAFAFHISQPMHMVFRSANLMVTYAFGKLFFGKR